MKHTTFRISICIFFLLFHLDSFSKCKTSYDTGIRYLDNPNYFKAEGCFRLALMESKKEGNKYIEMKSYLELGRISTLLSKNDTAVLYFNSGKGIAKKYFPSNSGIEAIFILELGKVNQELGNIEAAGEFYKQAINKMEYSYGKNDIRTALAYSEYAGYFTFKKLPVQEWFWSIKAFDILERTKVTNPNYACPILVQHATATKELYSPVPDSFPHYYPLIRRYYFRSLQLARHYFHKPSFDEGKALQGLANTYTDCIKTYFSIKKRDAERNWNIADSLYKEAIRVKMEALGKYNSTVATSKYTHALIYWYHPSLEKQIESLSKFNEAMAVLDSSFYPSGDIDFPNTTNTFDPYLMSVLLANKSVVLGIIYKQTNDVKYLNAQHEHNKQRLILWDYILASFSTKNIGSVISIWNHTPFEEAIQSAYDLYLHTGNLNYAKEIFEIAEQGKNNDYTQFLIHSGKINAGTERFKSYLISLESLKSKLQEGQAFIEFVQTPSEDIRYCYGIVVTKSRYGIVQLEQKNTTDSLQDVLFLAMRNGDIKAYSQSALKIFQILLLPLLDKAGDGISSFVICPSGTYSRIPFEALTISNKNSSGNDFRNLDYLLNHYTISYALNAGLCFSSFQKRNTTACKGLALFLPEFDTLPKLLFSRKQAERLQEKLKGDFYFDSNATVKNFYEKASGHSIVQISTHSISTLAKDKDGQLLFSKGKVFLSELYGREIYTDLCIVSSCQTGDGRQEYAEGTKSFSRTFAYGGAKTTISTLWCVDDKSTAQILDEVYNQLAKGVSASSSLANAKKEYIATCSSSVIANPFYWAGLVFTGNPETEVKIDYFDKSVLYFSIFLVVVTIMFMLRITRK